MGNTKVSIMSCLLLKNNFRSFFTRFIICLLVFSRLNLKKWFQGLSFGYQYAAYQDQTYCTSRLFLINHPEYSWNKNVSYLQNAGYPSILFLLYCNVHL